MDSKSKEPLIEYDSLSNPSSSELPSFSSALLIPSIDVFDVLILNLLFDPAKFISALPLLSPKDPISVETPNEFDSGCLV